MAVRNSDCGISEHGTLHSFNIHSSNHSDDRASPVLTNNCYAPKIQGVDQRRYLFAMKRQTVNLWIIRLFAQSQPN